MLRFACVSLLLLCWSGLISAADRPNVLWITSEDNGPQLGCYGDDYAVSPNIDALAAKGCRYLHCWSNAPVCAPARTTIITGMYPTSLGAEHMRSMVKLPDGIKLYPQYLREAGYYCTNNSKEDYNVEKPGQVWDDSSKNAHWKNCPEGKAFFAIFNHTISHESQIRNHIDDKDRIHNPAQVRVPAYHPDMPEVRKDWAQYYDRITMMDKLVGKNLKELEEAGLADDTIVFYYGDHGSGMPRSKRMPYNSGLHVPLIVYVPEKWEDLATADCQQGGGASERLVSFVDLAPTLLSLCGVDIPAHMQGHAFLGPKATEPQPCIYGFRGRMDERIDMIRSITDGRYVYIRNFMPHRPCGQHVDYMFQTPTTRVWYDMWKRGECNEAQSHFWEPKPAEELYDLKNDPDEVLNLVDDPAMQKTRDQLREAVVEHMRRTMDLGLLPEAELHRSAGGRPPIDLRTDLMKGTQRIPPRYDRLLAVVNRLAFSATSDADAETLNQVTSALIPDDPVSHYWGLQQLLSRQWAPAIAEQARSTCRGRLSDESPSVRIMAAEALARYGNDEDLALALPVLLEYANAEKHGVYNAIAALNAIDYLDDKAASIKDEVAKLPKKDPNADGRTASYCDRLIEHILVDLN
ncbi:MAG: sulfatase-like hydrolase/transferase [Planctomycetaceae bacterium]|nr:sulfatase-like hydrolase/transferase [Planctomycetaceae bacterium]